MKARLHVYLDIRRTPRKPRKLRTSSTQTETERNYAQTERLRLGFQPDETEAE